MVAKEWGPGEYEAEYRRLYKKAHEEILQPWEMIRYRRMWEAREARMEWAERADSDLKGLLAPE